MTLVELGAIVEIIRDLAVAVAAALGAYLAWKRLRPAAQQASATERSASAADNQAALARRTYVTEQLRLAVRDLRTEELEVRLAAIYVMRQIGRDFPDLADPVFETLQGYLAATGTDYGNEPEPDILAIQEILKSRLSSDE